MEKMEYYSAITMQDEQMELPPGFRFHPTDEELITHYLSQKFLDSNFNCVAIGEADLNKIEPWDLPEKAKMGEKEWYFFCIRDRKYPSGSRTNRATEAGYWKATGKDKEIYRAKILVGMKKTLVFYKGRAPKGEKTNWVLHEFRLEGQHHNFNHINLPKNEWVISRVFKKNSVPKQPSYDLEPPSPQQELKPTYLPELPPLVDCSPNNSETNIIVTNAVNPSHVTCFSTPLVEDHQQQNATTLEYDPEATLFPDIPTDHVMSGFEFNESIFGPFDSMMELLEGKCSSPKQELSLEADLSNEDAFIDYLWS